MDSLTIHSVELVSDGRRQSDSWVRVEYGLIAAIGHGDSWRSLRSAELIDGTGRVLVPGFVDIHCHGGSGLLGDPATALAVHRSHGTTRSLVSLVSAPVSQLEQELARVATLCRDDETVIGAHLEGPFLAHTRRGAHDHNALIPPSLATLDRFIEAAQGRLRMVTLAPELDGAIGLIELLVTSGIVAAIGHSEASYDQAMRAFDAGASVLTHAFNGMPRLDPREPGALGAAMKSSHVVVEVIADGVHVHPAVLTLASKAFHGRLALVTDAMSATGQGDGQYTLGSMQVEVVNGAAWLADGSSLAGSTLTTDAALRYAVREVGMSLNDVVDALTRTPATAIGLSKYGLAQGNLADLVLLDGNLTVDAVWAAGIRSRT
jgi:N-acetylglucosamine-6-phosphate deacetylase